MGNSIAGQMPTWSGADNQSHRGVMLTDQTCKWWLRDLAKRCGDELLMKQ